MNRANRSGMLSILCALLALSTGCVDEAASVDEDIASTEEALSPADWSPISTVGGDLQGARHGGAIATLNGVTYMVHSGGCDDCRALWWTRLGPNGWTDDVKIPNQLAADKVSLAAFNGRIYMFHTGDTDTTAIWVSRFDPATEQWSPNYKLIYRSRETPAIAVYQGKLHIVGSLPTGTNQLWMATLDTNDTLSQQKFLIETSISRVSLAVFNGRLYVAHRRGATNLIVTNSYDGWSWGIDEPVPAGDGTNIEGAVPVLASHDGYLHLVYKRPGSSALWWSTFDTVAWAPTVTLGTMSSYAHPGLGVGGAGLVLTLTIRCPSGRVCFSPNMLYTSQYRSPWSGGFFEQPPIDTLAP